MGLSRQNEAKPCAQDINAQSQRVVSKESKETLRSLGSNKSKDASISSKTSLYMDAMKMLSPPNEAKPGAQDIISNASTESPQSLRSNNSKDAGISSKTSLYMDVMKMVSLPNEAKPGAQDIISNASTESPQSLRSNNSKDSRISTKTSLYIDAMKILSPPNEAKPEEGKSSKRDVRLPSKTEDLMAAMKCLGNSTKVSI